MSTDTTDLTPAQHKTVATLTAAFALKGIEVQLVDGGFLIVQRGVTKHVATLAQLEAEARRILGLVE